MKKLFAIIGLLISISAGAQDMNVVRNGTVTLVCPMTTGLVATNVDSMVKVTTDSNAIGKKTKWVPIGGMKIKPVLLTDTPHTHNCAPCYASHSIAVPQNHGSLMGYDVNTAGGTLTSSYPLPKYDTAQASFLVSGKTGELKAITGYVIREPYEYVTSPEHDQTGTTLSVAVYKTGYKNPKFLNNSYKPFPKSILIWDYKILDKQ